MHDYLFWPKKIMEIRYPCHPYDFRHYSTEKIRQQFLIDKIMEPDRQILVYSHFDRMIAGGVVPVNRPIQLENPPYEKAPFLLFRRELGVINTGGTGMIEANGMKFRLGYLDGLYLGKGTEMVLFSSADTQSPARFYLNSALSWEDIPPTLIRRDQARVIELGNAANSNVRSLRQYIVPGIAESCQLMMGVTSIHEGSSWNTMPCHRHELRMEIYYYFGMNEGETVCHLMGEPGETRPVWVNDQQAVISPPWSIHTASGTGPYHFIWGMAGSDSDPDPVATTNIR